MAGPWGAPSEGDSGAGVNTVIGNSFNPSGLSTTRIPEGLGPYRDPVAHSPTGQLYSVPWADDNPEGALNGSVEVGILNNSGDKNAQLFRQYSDQKDGLLLSYFSFSANGDDHRYLQLSGGNVGRDDQYFTGAAGRYNDYRLRVFYNSTPHVFSTTARPIWNGVGTDKLTLKEPLQSATNQPGSIVADTAAGLGATHLLVNSVINNTPDTTIGMLREKTGLRFDKNIGSDINFFVDANVEQRKGSRTFGLAPNGPGGAGSSPAVLVAQAANNPLQPAEPINYTTTEAQAGLGWKIDELSSLTALLSASIFRDAYKIVSVDDPYMAPVAATPTTDAVNKHTLSFSTPPNNEAYTFKLGYTRDFPELWKSNFRTNISWSRQNQDDTLVPYTLDQGSVNVGGARQSIANTGVNPSDARFWNSLIGPNGLPTVTRMTSGLHNNIYMVNLEWSLQPTDQLSLNAKARQYKQDNFNDFISCNPSLAAAMNASGLLTGVASCVPSQNTSFAPIYGFLVEDGSGGLPNGLTAAQVGSGVANLPATASLATQYTTGGGNGARAKSFSGSFKQNNYVLSGDYMWTNKISVNASYEREDVWRQMRERDWTYEDKWKIGVVDRDLWNGTLRASYERDDRTGSTWKPFGYIETCPAYSYDPAGCWNNINNQSVSGAALTPAYLATLSAIGNTARPPEGQKHDLNDRKRNIVVVRYNTMLTSTLDGMVTYRMNHEEYPNPGVYNVGRDKNNDNTISLSLNWQPSVETNVFGDYSHQTNTMGVTDPRGFGSNCTYANLIAGACSAIPGAPGAPVANSIYGNANAGTIISVKGKDSNDVLTLGASHKFSQFWFDGTYQYTRTRTGFTYDTRTYLAAAGDYLYTNAAGANIGGPYQFPDMVFDRNVLTLAATVPVDKKITLRGSYTADRTTVTDWHYTPLNPAVPSSAASGGRIYLDTGPQQSYTVHSLGLYLQYKM